MTTSFILAPGEEFIQCPYNTAHQITNARLITHLEKCRKAYLKNLTVEGRQRIMKICRHNALHHIPAPELRLHEEGCGDAISVVRHMAYHNSAEGNRQYEERRKQDSSSGWNEVSRSKRSSSPSSHNRHSHSRRDKAETQPLRANDWGLEEEDWEADCAGSGPGYDPEIKLKNEVVIYNPPGLTKSERKQFRNEIRQKAAEMSVKGEAVELPTAGSFDMDVKPNINDLKIKEEGKRSPREPGEIDDEDDNNVKPDISHQSGTGGNRKDDRHHDSHNDRRNSYYDRRDSRGDGYNSRSSDQRPSSTSSSSSRSQYSSHSKPSHSRTSTSWTQRVQEDYYPDSDDFEGNDPFI